MKWLSLLKYLVDALFNWFAEWKPVIDEERRQAKEAADKASGKVVDVPFTEVKNSSNG